MTGVAPPQAAPPPQADHHARPCRRPPAPPVAPRDTRGFCSGSGCRSAHHAEAGCGCATRTAHTARDSATRTSRHNPAPAVPATGCGFRTARHEVAGCGCRTALREAAATESRTAHPSAGCGSVSLSARRALGAGGLPLERLGAQGAGAAPGLRILEGRRPPPRRLRARRPYARVRLPAWGVAARGPRPPPPSCARHGPEAATAAVVLRGKAMLE